MTHLHFIDTEIYTCTPDTTRSSNKGIHFIVEKKSNHTLCPMCEKETDKRQDLTQRINNEGVIHFGITQKEKLVLLHPNKRYFRCPECGISFMEEFDFLASKGRHTSIIEAQIYAMLPTHKVKAISQRLYISPWRVYKILNEMTIEKLNTTGTKIWEMLDNIVLQTQTYINKRNEHLYIISDSISGLTIEVIKKPNTESLNHWYNKLSDTHKKKIKGLDHTMSPVLKEQWASVSLRIKEIEPGYLEVQKNKLFSIKQ